MRRISIGTALALTIFVMGCRRDDEIQTYRVSKEASPTMPSAGPPREITWTTPKGWKEQAPSSMRVGSFSVKGENVQEADVSVIPLSGEAGGELANINRWRGQIDLEPLTEAELPKHIEKITPGGRPMHLVDMANHGKRLIAAIYPQGPRSWFFKMLGEDTTVEATKPTFLQFLNSLKFHEN